MRGFAIAVGLIALAVVIVLWMTNVRTAKAPDADNSGVRGTVLLGPTCPVMREPPDPGCADRAYTTTVVVRRVGSNSIFVTEKSDAKGTFEFSLPPGSYTLTAGGDKMLPRCSSVDITVAMNEYATTTISCDTGIR